jgi:hypothetical protein
MPNANSVPQIAPTTPATWAHTPAFDAKTYSNNNPNLVSNMQQRFTAALGNPGAYLQRLEQGGLAQAWQKVSDFLALKRGKTITVTQLTFMLVDDNGQNFWNNAPLDLINLGNNHFYNNTEAAVETAFWLVIMMSAGLSASEILDCLKAPGSPQVEGGASMLLPARPLGSGPAKSVKDWMLYQYNSGTNIDLIQLHIELA